MFASCLLSTTVEYCKPTAADIVFVFVLCPVYYDTTMRKKNEGLVKAAIFQCHNCLRHAPTWEGGRVGSRVGQSIRSCLWVAGVSCIVLYCSV